jgi:hypothetical protein
LPWGILKQRLLHLGLAGSNLLVNYVVEIFAHKYIAHIPLELVAFHRDSGRLGRVTAEAPYLETKFGDSAGKQDVAL